MGSGRESHSFCVYVQCPVCVCVCVVRQDESEIKEGEVGGWGGSPSQSSTIDSWTERDGAEWSTANWMDWSITLHLSGGPKIPLKDKHVSPTPTMGGGGGHWSHVERVQGCFQTPAEDCGEEVLVSYNSRVIIKQHVKIFMVENRMPPPSFRQKWPNVATKKPDCAREKGTVRERQKLQEERRETSPRYNLNELGSQLSVYNV